MSEENNETGGTPEPDDVDATSVEGGTQVSEGSDAQYSQDWQKKFNELNQLRLQDLAKIEEANRQAKEYEALKESLEQSPAARGREAEDPRVVRRREIEGFARSNDAFAQELLEQAKTQEEIIQALYMKAQLDDIEDPKLRQKVKTHYAKNRSRGIDIRAAHKEVEAEDLRLQNEALKKQLEQFQKSKPDPDVVRTVARDVTSSEHKLKKMTTAQFDREAAQIAARDGDKAERAFKSRLMNGEIQLTD
jgi:hypothetical protein